MPTTNTSRGVCAPTGVASSTAASAATPNEARVVTEPLSSRPSSTPSSTAPKLSDLAKGDGRNGRAVRGSPSRHRLAVRPRRKLRHAPFAVEAVIGCLGSKLECVAGGPFGRHVEPRPSHVDRSCVPADRECARALREALRHQDQNEDQGARELSLVSGAQRLGLFGAGHTEEQVARLAEAQEQELSQSPAGKLLEGDFVVREEGEIVGAGDVIVSGL